MPRISLINSASERRPEYSAQFQRDVKRARKRGKNLEKLTTLLRLLIQGESLPRRYQDHPLKNNCSGYRDAHVEPDWLLIYYVSDEVVRFERIGAHADLID